MTTKKIRVEGAPKINMDKQNSEMQKFFNLNETSRQTKAQQIFFKKVRDTAERFDCFN